jgi:hypothetical protein
MPFGDLYRGSPFCVGTTAIANVSENIPTDNPKPWSLVIRNGMLTVGCQTHSFRDWWNFTDAEIEAMHKQALLWWRCNKDNVFNLLVTMGLWSDRDEAPTWQDDWF